ncbi:glutamate-rich protein 3 [Cuculus canorus]|uniref:glutamate-rich protein 3 n=1 Tax=Cuculus canorus TaxID=55661 RepID=UPI0023AB0889|nr:glutamate-rich protein 3 [Cuculus canorus]
MPPGWSEARARRERGAGMTERAGGLERGGASAGWGGARGAGVARAPGLPATPCPSDGRDAASSVGGCAAVAAAAMGAPQAEFLGSYNSLTDKHLVGYFSKARIRRHLQRSGLISRSGRIISEKEYRLNVLREDQLRCVQECLAQAIFRRILDMERHRELERKRRLENSVKRERVHNIKVEESRISVEGANFVHAPHPPLGPRGHPRPHPFVARRLSGQSQLRACGSVVGDSGEHLSHQHQAEETVFCKMGERSGLRCMNSVERVTGISPYQLPVIGNFMIPVPPPPREKGDKSVNAVRAGMLRGRRFHPTTAPNDTKQLLTKNSGGFCKPSLQSNAIVTMMFLGKGLRLSPDHTDHRHEIKVYQQHCGGQNLCVYKGKLLQGETFQFISERHHGFPVGLSFFLNGILVDRMSCCCEYKHHKRSRLGGRHGYFILLKVEGASPCYRCIMSMGLDKKPSSPKGKMENQQENHVDSWRGGVDSEPSRRRARSLSSISTQYSSEDESHAEVMKDGVEDEEEYNIKRASADATHAQYVNENGENEQLRVEEKEETSALAMEGIDEAERANPEDLTARGDTGVFHENTMAMQHQSLEVNGECKRARSVENDTEEDGEKNASTRRDDREENLPVPLESNGMHLEDSDEESPERPEGAGRRPARSFSSISTQYSSEDESHAEVMKDGVEDEEEYNIKRASADATHAQYVNENGENEQLRVEEKEETSALAMEGIDEAERANPEDLTARGDTGVFHENTMAMQHQSLEVNGECKRARSVENDTEEDGEKNASTRRDDREENLPVPLESNGMHLEDSDEESPERPEGAGRRRARSLSSISTQYSSEDESHAEVMKDGVEDEEEYNIKRASADATHAQYVNENGENEQLRVEEKEETSALAMEGIDEAERANPEDLTARGDTGVFHENTMAMQHQSLEVNGECKRARSVENDTEEDGEKNASTRRDDREENLPVPLESNGMHLEDSDEESPERPEGAGRRPARSLSSISTQYSSEDESHAEVMKDGVEDEEEYNIKRASADATHAQYVNENGENEQLRVEEKEETSALAMEGIDEAERANPEDLTARGDTGVFHENTMAMQHQSLEVNGECKRARSVENDTEEDCEKNASTRRDDREENLPVPLESNGMHLEDSDEESPERPEGAGRRRARSLSSISTQYSSEDESHAEVMKDGVEDEEEYNIKRASADATHAQYVNENGENEQLRVEEKEETSALAMEGIDEAERANPEDLTARGDTGVFHENTMAMQHQSLEVNGECKRARSVENDTEEDGEKNASTRRDDREENLPVPLESNGMHLEDSDEESPERPEGAGRRPARSLSSISTQYSSEDESHAEVMKDGVEDEEEYNIKRASADATHAQYVNENGENEQLRVEEKEETSALAMEGIDEAERANPEDLTARGDTGVFHENTMAMQHQSLEVNGECKRARSVENDTEEDGEKNASTRRDDREENLPVPLESNGMHLEDSDEESPERPEGAGRRRARSLSSISTQYSSEDESHAEVMKDGVEDEEEYNIKRASADATHAQYVNENGENEQLRVEEKEETSALAMEGIDEAERAKPEDLTARGDTGVFHENTMAMQHQSLEVNGECKRARSVENDTEEDCEKNASTRRDDREENLPVPLESNGMHLEDSDEESPERPEGAGRRRARSLSSISTQYSSEDESHAEVMKDGVEDEEEYNIKRASADATHAQYVNENGENEQLRVEEKEETSALAMEGIDEAERAKPEDLTARGDTGVFHENTMAMQHQSLEVNGECKRARSVENDTEEDCEKNASTRRDDREENLPVPLESNGMHLEDSDEESPERPEGAAFSAEGRRTVDGQKAAEQPEREEQMTDKREALEVSEAKEAVETTQPLVEEVEDEMVSAAEEATEKGGSAGKGGVVDAVSEGEEAVNDAGVAQEAGPSELVAVREGSLESAKEHMFLGEQPMTETSVSTPAHGDAGTLPMEREPARAEGLCRSTHPRPAAPGTGADEVEDGRQEETEQAGVKAEGEQPGLCENMGERARMDVSESTRTTEVILQREDVPVGGRPDAPGATGVRERSCDPCEDAANPDAVVPSVQPQDGEETLL